ncbi:MAG TPA: hypothetical protein VF771_09510 [Longimicrobiaceae bacterium]
MPKRIALVALPALFACAPVVTHGPRVEPGTTVTGNFGVPALECGKGNGCNTGIAPSFSFGVRRGWVPDSARAPSFLLGLSLPVFDPVAPELDAYVQAPAPGMFAAGAGALASPHHVEPYVEAGFSRPNGDGWFATAGYAWLFADPRSYILNEQPRMKEPPRYWAPGVGFHGHVLGRNLTAYASGALGRYVDRELASTPDGRTDTTIVRKNVRMLVIGVSGQLDPGRIWPLPFPPPIPYPR